MSKKSWDKEWIHFSKRARRGIFVLLLLFVVVAVSPRLYHNYFYIPPAYDVKYSALENSIIDSIVLEDSRYSQPVEKFNPNTYSQKEWMQIGLSEKQAKSILKYLGSGAQLKVKSDLKKLYVIDDELYLLLEPKIDLPDAVVRENYSDNSKYKQEAYAKDTSLDIRKLENNSAIDAQFSPISINSSSLRELQKVPGIGPYFAKEILKIREDYGGIISNDQLLDIFKMDEEKLNEILPYLIIDKSEVNKLDINSASEEQLRKHPLITRDMAKSIVFFRENHKRYRSLDGLLLSPYIDGQVLKEIEPYLKVE